MKKEAFVCKPVPQSEMNAKALHLGNKLPLNHIPLLPHWFDLGSNFHHQIQGVSATPLPAKKGAESIRAVTEVKNSLKLDVPLE